MNDVLANNIMRLRKRQHMTQEELAGKLNLSFQAVSKWETGQSCPDISLLSDLAALLDTDINTLMGYCHTRKQVTIYEEEYRREDFYWGMEPSSMCYRMMERLPPTKPFKLLDVGCGEGKDAIFFARNGYQVIAFDVAIPGVEKTKRLADRFDVDVQVFKADIREYRLSENVDAIFSSGVLHYLPLELRDETIANYQAHTNKGGVHAFNVFVPKPFIPPPPENEPNANRWLSGELMTYYTDWLIHTSEEDIFDCQSSGIPHQHCMDKLIAKKMMGLGLTL